VSDKVELSGIFNEGYGVIPKKLMKMQFDKEVGKQKGKNIKLVLAYMLSFTGAGKIECFPSIETIANDLELSKPTVIEAINNAVKLNLIDKEQMYPDDPLKHNNKYILKFMNISGIDVVSKESLLTGSNGLTYKVKTFEQNNNIINNNINNIYSIFEYWNTKGNLTIHKKGYAERKFKKRHLDAIADYSEEEILKAIDNYSHILESEKYFWSHRWTLDDFIIRGLDRFVDTAKPLENFKKEQSQDDTEINKMIQELRDAGK